MKDFRRLHVSLWEYVNRRRLKAQYKYTLRQHKWNTHSSHPAACVNTDIFFGLSIDLRPLLIPQMKNVLDSQNVGCFPTGTSSWLKCWLSLRSSSSAAAAEQQRWHIQHSSGSSAGPFSEDSCWSSADWKLLQLHNWAESEGRGQGPQGWMDEEAQKGPPNWGHTPCRWTSAEVLLLTRVKGVN